MSWKSWMRPAGAQLQTVLVDRREDYPTPRLDSHGHRRIESLTEL
jgi:hypothetical protein